MPPSLEWLKPEKQDGHMGLLNIENPLMFYRMHEQREVLTIDDIRCNLGLVSTNIRLSPACGREPERKQERLHPLLKSRFTLLRNFLLSPLQSASTNV